MLQANKSITKDIGAQKLFPDFDISKQQIRLEELFQILNDEIHHNPDIQTLGIIVFGTEDKFFSWYLSLTNRGPAYGIPDGISKIDVLKKIQHLDKDIIREGIEVFDGEEGRFYRWLMKKNYFAHREGGLPIHLSNEKLKQSLKGPKYGNFR